MDPSSRSTPPPPEGRLLDVICLGRLAVDLYAEQLGARLEDAATFARYLGGSSANVAFGCARLGLRAAMLSRVGDDHMGRFLLEALRREGCDVSHVSSDPRRLTGLVLLGIKDRETFPLIFYREDCADMAIPEEGIDEAFIASSRALAITGTHLSTEHTHRVATLALGHARRHGVRTVLDVDYRPVLWGLTGRAAGEQRFVESDRVTAHLQSVLPLFDLVVGTEEEFRIAGGGEGLLPALRGVRAATPAALVVKLGASGCAVIDGEVPSRLEDALLVPGFPVEVLNVLGAGDAFLAGFLKGWLGGASLAESGRLGNACGALVVTRHACSAAMPTPAELARFLASPTARPDLDAELSRLHRVTAPRPAWDDLHVLAFDHRNQFFDMAREVGAPESRLPGLKRLLVQAVAETESRLGLHGHVGVLVDDTYGEDALHAATGRGWWLGRPVEVPGSRPLELEGGRSIGTRLAAWPREQVVKCLVRYHPDEPVEDRLEQETQLLSLQAAVQATGHELLLEVIPPAEPAGEGEAVARALKRLYNIGIRPEWWKLAPMPAATWRLIDALLAERDPHCRGVVILGLDASIDELAQGFREAASARCCRGFVVGRTIFRDPSREWLAGRIDDQGLVSGIRSNFEALIRVWREARGKRMEAA